LNQQGWFLEMRMLQQQVVREFNSSSNSRRGRVKWVSIIRLDLLRLLGLVKGKIWKLQ
jgi:hypothetical protein